MRWIQLDSIDSTNNYGKLHFSTFPKDQITCITAEEQTKGRGRYHRKWFSPKGVNLYASFCFCLPTNTLHLISLAQLMAYSCATMLAKNGFHPKIKWPNDLQLKGKKIAGILCETQFHGSLVEVTLGIGINVNLEEPEAALIDQPATSLKIESGQHWDRTALLKELQMQFTKDLSLFRKEGFTPFHNRFEEWLALKGKTVRCFDGSKEWVGQYHSLTPDGRLTLLLPDQTLHTLSSGEL